MHAVWGNLIDHNLFPLMYLVPLALSSWHEKVLETLKTKDIFTFLKSSRDRLYFIGHKSLFAC